MSDPIHWVTIDGHHTDREMKELIDYIDGEIDDADVILTTKDIEPIDEEERQHMIERLTQALEDE